MADVLNVTLPVMVVDSPEEDASNSSNIRKLSPLKLQV
jgi:hypothetical protein